MELASILSGINWLDILYFTILLGMIYKGSHAGVGSQLLSLAWWFVLIFFALGYYSGLASAVFGFILQSWARPISFFLITIIVFALIKFMEMIFNISVTDALPPLERIGGALIAAVRTFLVFGIISVQLLLLPIPFLKKTVEKDSKTGPFFVDLDVKIFSFMTKNVQFIPNKDPEYILGEILDSSGV